MGARWRLAQIDHNRRARERLAAGGKSGVSRFWDWEIVLMSYEVVTALDGYAEKRGLPVPKNHNARSALVARHLPHFANPYDDLYGLSLTARCYERYIMTENDGLIASRCHEVLTRSIPVH